MVDDGMLSVSHANILQYYVTGYRTSIDKSYDIASCSAVGLEDTYSYTGYPIRPSFKLMSNVGDFLVDGTDYTILYGENIDSYGSVSCVGIDPWEGTFEQTFTIA